MVTKATFLAMNTKPLKEEKEEKQTGLSYYYHQS